MKDQHPFGRVFWIIIVILLCSLGIYWSVSAYKDWEDQPVLTTATTTGLPISVVDFPSGEFSIIKLCNKKKK